MKSSTLHAIIRLTARDRLLIESSKGVAMDEAPDTLAVLADVVRALDRPGSSHAMVGGMAVGIRSGVPRATADINIAVQSTVARHAITGVLRSDPRL